MLSYILKSKLDNCINDFFPSTGEWNISDIDGSNVLDENRFPFNLNNEEWLVAMLIKHIVKKDIDLGTDDFYTLVASGLDAILSYVRESSKFAAKKHDYALKLVEHQIDYMIDPDSDWCGDKGTDYAMIFFSKYYYIDFRDCIVRSLDAIGIDKSIIEEGIEKNSDKWLDQALELTFYNIYTPITASMIFGSEEIPEYNDESHKESWIVLRKHEYYLEHKEVIDKCCKDKNDMEIAEDKLEGIKANVKKKNIERLSSLPFGNSKINTFRRKVSDTY